MRNHGADESKVISPDCDIWGTNARIDNIHAAILAYKLTYYDAAIERRRAIARRYDEAFVTIEALALPPAPDADPRRFDIYQNYEMCCDQRDALRTHLAGQGIGTIVQWGGTGQPSRTLAVEDEIDPTRFLAETREVRCGGSVWPALGSFAKGNVRGGRLRRSLLRDHVGERHGRWSTCPLANHGLGSGWIGQDRHT